HDLLRPLGAVSGREQHAEHGGHDAEPALPREARCVRFRHAWHTAAYSTVCERRRHARRKKTWKLPMADKPKKRAAGAADAPVRDLETVLAGLRAAASEQFRIDQEKRYGIVTNDERYGTPMASIKAVAKALGRDHAFAEALWRTRVYEARMLASMVAEPDKLTAAQMDRWVEDCD